MAMVSGPRVFFDIIGTFQAGRLIKDADAQMAVVESIMLDAVDGVRQSLMGIGEVITGIVNEIVPLGVALSEATIEFEKFAGQNKALAAEIIDTGAAFGFTAEQALSAGARMAQLSAVIGEAATAQATELGQQFALISGMGTEEAMQRMINLQQQTGFMYGDLTNQQFRLLDAENQRKTVMSNTLEVLDQLNTVENRSASNMKQITFVMNQFAAQAHQTGESIAFMAAMSATLIEAGEEQGKAGRALRMIYARLGSNVQNNNQLLKQYGVTTKDATTGALRPMSEIVLDLAKIFPQLTAEQRQNIVQTVAGNDHYVRFVKLIENSGRMSELAADAINNQSSAQEEVNRVTDDASTKYKEALADLEHLRAEMGQGLLPQMTDFVRFQIRINQALMDLSAMPFFGKMGVFVVQMQQYMSVFGKVFDMMLQIKSVSIAMKTYESVLSAVNGKELIRTDNLKAAKSLSMVGLSLQEEQLHLANLISLKQMELNELLEIEGVKIDMAAQKRLGIAAREEILNQTVQERNILLDRQVNRMAEYGALQASATAMAEAERNSMRTMVLLNNTLSTTQRTRLDENIAKEQVLVAEYHLQIIALERKLHMDRRLKDQGKAKVEMDIAGVQLVIDKHEQRLQQMVRMRHEDDLAIIMKEEHISVDARANALGDEMLMQMQSLGMEKQELLLLTMAEIEAISILTMTKDGLNDAEVMAVMNKKLLAIEERKLLLGHEKQTVAIHRMSAAYSGLSMVTGVLSMGVGALGHRIGLTEDENESMRVSIILMTMSMIPAIIQMGVMTAQMMGIKTFADLAAFSIMGMNTAMSFTVVLAGGVALVALAIWMADVAMEAQVAAVEVDSLNSGLANTSQILRDMSGEDAQAYDVPDALLKRQKDFPKTIDLTTMTLTQFNAALAHNRDAISAYQEDQKIYAADDPFYAMIQNDINALNEFENVLKQGAIAEFGEQIKGLTDDEKITATLDALGRGDIIAPKLYAPEGAKFGGSGYDLARYETTEMVSTVSQGGDSGYKYGEVYDRAVTQSHIIENTGALLQALEDGIITMDDLTDRGREFFLQFSNNAITASEDFYQFEEGLIDGIGGAFTEAEEKLRSFASAREELFFGGKASHLTGDMMKQVVNKGVENLYSNVELVMTNNFNGITIDDAIEKVTSGVMSQLVQAGVPLNNAGV